MNFRPVLYLIFMVFLMFGYVYGHEVTHQTIYEYHGCESTIHWFGKGAAAYTQAEPDCNHTQTLQLSQNMVDAIGYPVSIIIMLIGSIVVMLDVMCGLKRDEIIYDLQHYEVITKMKLLKDKLEKIKNEKTD